MKLPQEFAPYGRIPPTIARYSKLPAPKSPAKLRFQLLREEGVDFVLKQRLLAFKSGPGGGSIKTGVYVANAASGVQQ